jgi:hypothetical protein
MYIPLGIYRSGITGLYGSLFLDFKEVSMLLSIMVILIYIPTNCVYTFCFTASLPAFVVAFALEDGHSKWNEMKF